VQAGRAQKNPLVSGGVDVDRTEENQLMRSCPPREAVVVDMVRMVSVIFMVKT
jgi:hypothetical protein